MDQLSNAYVCLRSLKELLNAVDMTHTHHLTDELSSENWRHKLCRRIVKRNDWFCEVFFLLGEKRKGIKPETNVGAGRELNALHT